MRTPTSAALFERARHALPLGVASSFQAYDPYPLFMGDARGSRITDVDGNEYIDFDMAFGVLAAGHSHPLLAEALQYRVANGTCYTFPVEDGIALAEEIKARFGADLVRFSNSGTEATMDAIRLARGVTGRDKIVKIEGSYHGHHDAVMVSVYPSLEEIGDRDNPHSVPYGDGYPAALSAISSSWQMMITTSGERSTFATIGITRWSGRRNGRVSVLSSGAMGL